MATQQYSTPYAGKRVSLGDPELDALLLWKDPRKSGIVFGGITAAYILLEWTKYSLINLVANFLLIAVIGAFLWNNVANFTNMPPVPLPRILSHGLQEREFHVHAEPVRQGLNKSLVFVRRVVTGKEVILTIETALALYVAAKIGNWFSTLGLAYTVVILAFSAPKLYEYKKDEIDQMTHRAVHESKKGYSQYVEPYMSKIPRASTSTNTGVPKAAQYQSTADSASVAPVGAEPKKAI